MRTSRFASCTEISRGVCDIDLRNEEILLFIFQNTNIHSVINTSESNTAT